MKTTSHALRALLMLLMLPAAARAADEWQVGTTPSFSSGRYGTDSRTEVLHTPITARRLFTDADLTLVFPMTCIWGDAGVTVINGTPVRTERLQAAGTTTPTTTTGRGETTPTRDGTHDANEDHDGRCRYRRHGRRAEHGLGLRHGRHRRARPLLRGRRARMDADRRHPRAREGADGGRRARAWEQAGSMKASGSRSAARSVAASWPWSTAATR